MLFPEHVSPGKYKQVKIGREEKKNIGKNESILFKLNRTRESASPVVSTVQEKLSMKELSVNSLSWSGPADSHFVHSSFHNCTVVLNKKL